jgi:hypothetical protein
MCVVSAATSTRSEVQVERVAVGVGEEKDLHWYFLEIENFGWSALLFL